MRRFRKEQEQSMRRSFLGAAFAATLAGVVLGTLIPSQQVEAQPATTFSGNAAIVLHFVKPGSTAAYEGVMARLGEALQKSENTETDRQAQARGWKVYRAGLDISGQGNVMYAWIIDPVVGGADYAVSTIINEVFPGESLQIDKVYSESFTDAALPWQWPIDLRLVADLSTTQHRELDAGHHGSSDDAAILLQFVRPKLASSYERVMRQVGEALRRNVQTWRHMQVRRWKVYRAGLDMSGRGNAMYVWFGDPEIVSEESGPEAFLQGVCNAVSAALRIPMSQLRDTCTSAVVTQTPIELRLAVDLRPRQTRNSSRNAANPVSLAFGWLHHWPRDPVPLKLRNRHESVMAPTRTAEAATVVRPVDSGAKRTVDYSA